MKSQGTRRSAILKIASVKRNLFSVDDLEEIVDIAGTLGIVEADDRLLEELNQHELNFEHQLTWNGEVYSDVRGQLKFELTSALAEIGRLDALENEKVKLEYIDIVEKYEEKQREIKIQSKIERDYFAFFNLPEANADMGHWLEYPAWSLDEAVALSFGTHPKKVTRSKMTAYLAGPAGSQFRDDYFQRRSIIVRALATGALSKPITPEEFSIWLGLHTTNSPKAMKVFAQNLLKRKAPPAQSGETNRLYKCYEIILQLLNVHYTVERIDRPAKPSPYASKKKLPEIKLKAAASDAKVDIQTMRKIYTAAQLWAKTKDNSLQSTEDAVDGGAIDDPDPKG